MEDDESPIGGPLELPGEESPASQPIDPPKPARAGRKVVLIIVVVIVAAAGLGFGAYKMLRKPKAAPANTTSTQANNSTNSTASTISDIPEVSGTKDLSNQSLGVELSYPQNWKVTQTDRSSDGIKIESPDFNYMTVDGATVTGNFRFYIRKGARAVDSKYIGRGVAITASQPLTYASPLSTQRKTTNLSLFGLDTPDQFAFFLIAGNFSLKKGDTLGPSYGKEPETILITGGYSSKDLKDDFATNQVPLENYAKTNAYKQAIDIVKSLKLQ